jgi:hypothetical protein
MGVDLTCRNDMHLGFGRRNRPRPPAGGRFEADLGTARGRSYRVPRCAGMSTARCTPLMGLLDVYIDDTLAVDIGKAPGLVPWHAARQSWGRGTRARRACVFFYPE